MRMHSLCKLVSWLGQAEYAYWAYTPRAEPGPGPGDRHCALCVLGLGRGQEQAGHLDRRCALEYKAMTPLQLAREHCANYQSDGTCMSLTFDDKGTHKSFRPRGGRCLLSSPVERCLYFEECVMPMNVDAKNPDVAERRRHEFQMGILAYKKSTGQAVTKAAKAGDRLCPTCRDRPLEPGKKLCYVCRENKRKERTH